MKFYITAAIPYVNAAPHIGHALEVAQADVIARYHREKGEDVFYLTGTDENSLKVLQAAEKAGIPTKQFADECSKVWKEFYTAYNISFDIFKRTTEADHIQSAQDLWKRCNENGDIYKKQYQGLYCVACELFYTPEELDEKGECRYHPGRPLEEVKEENYFFRLSKYQDQLLKLIESDEYKIVPNQRKNEALGFIKQKLADFSISRSTKRSRGWGVPVPGDSEQIMYVWFDALNVYRSGALTHWPADLHVVGKDIMRFHAVYWPAILLSAKLPLPKELLVHGFVTLNGQKMSKTLGNVVDPIELVKKYGLDAVRYYLLREIPSTDDGDFSEEKFKTRYNADLANGLGNYTARVLTLARKAGILSFVKGVPEGRGISEEVAKAIADRKLHEALAIIWRHISEGDQYINSKKPWEMETGSAEQKEVMEHCVSILDSVAIALKPFLPATSEAILARPTTSLFPRL